MFRTPMIEYKTNAPITPAKFRDLLIRSSLGERRPVDDEACIRGMIENANLTISAWQGDTLVGIARSMTDFHYACYVSDLAVCRSVQRQGIGKTLLSLTQQALGPRCKVILVAAPDANDYYRELGFSNNPRCWVLDSEQPVETNGNVERNVIDPFDEFIDDDWA